MPKRSSPEQEEEKQKVLPAEESPPSAVFVVVGHYEALCGCSSDNQALGAYSTFEEASVALREAVAYMASDFNVYEDCYIGPESKRTSSINALSKGKYGEGTAYSWRETWGDDSATIYITEKFIGCGSCNSTFSIEPLKMVKKIKESKRRSSVNQRCLRFRSDKM